MPKNTKTQKHKKNQPATRYIVINEHNEEIELKSKLVWVVVSILVVGLVLFWFWTLRQSIDQSYTKEKTSSLSQEARSKVEELKKVLSETKDAISREKDAFIRQQELEKIKQQVLIQIQRNLDINNWPQHTSDNLNFSLQYPIYWEKEETEQALFLRSATNTPEIAAVITIDQRLLEDESLTVWVNNWHDTTTTNIYWLLGENNDLEIGGQKAIKYIADNLKSGFKESELHYVIFTAKDETVYMIMVSVPENGKLYEPVIQKIISTIKFN